MKVQILSPRLPYLNLLSKKKAHEIMSNRALWDVRKRHVWLASPATKVKPKLRARKRCGMQAAIDRKAPKATDDAATTAS